MRIKLYFLNADETFSLCCKYTFTTLKLFSHYAENEITYVQKYNKIRIKARKDTDKIIMLAVFPFFSFRILFPFCPYSSSLKRSDLPLYPVNKCFS